MLVLVSQEAQSRIGTHFNRHRIRVGATPLIPREDSPVYLTFAKVQNSLTLWLNLVHHLVAIASFTHLYVVHEFGIAVHLLLEFDAGRVFHGCEDLWHLVDVLEAVFLERVDGEGGSVGLELEVDRACRSFFCHLVTVER